MPPLTVFLDRDGVVNEYRRPTVLSWDKFAFHDGALDAIARLARADVQTFVVTNKAWIGLGILSEATNDDIHDRMLERIRDAGGRIDDVYSCPHTPIARCGCRKPQPGMLEQAASEHDVDPSRAWMVGDNVSDHQAGRAFGCRTILLETTHGDAIHRKARRAGETPDRFCSDLAEAVDVILREEGLAAGDSRKA